VAHPIQDLSAVSITHKAVGVRFATSAVRSRVKCDWAWRSPTQVFFILPFVLVGTGGCGIGVFESAMKTKRRRIGRIE
jgi:hypothetical protein